MEVAVLDCSVVAAFLLREREGKKLDPVIVGASKGAVRLVGPALLPFELINVVIMAQRKARIDEDTATGVLCEFNQLAIELDEAPGRPQRERIHQLAIDYGLTACDAAYLELSDRLGAPLYTLDSDLLKLKSRVKSIR